MYRHKVQYYETDRMGITHHSNYIRWMEEARTDFLEKLGWPYAKLESDGIISPVMSVSCQYRQSTTFADIVTIETKVLACRGAKLRLGYQMVNQKGQKLCQGETDHGFVTVEGDPVSLKKVYPDFYQALIDWQE